MTESWIIDQLIQQGVRHFCIAPGSRSTPLVSAAADHPKAKIHVHYDERGLGFFALGISQATRSPAVLIATSGTAVGNLLPSVMEAHHSYTPLILLTADRPHELRDCGANQTTDQIKIFQSFVRWQADLASELDENYFRSTLAQGYFYALHNPPGPVHINCPFKEPLYRQKPLIKEGKRIDLHLPRHTVEKYTTQHSKGLILAGRLPDPNDVVSILELAKRLHWPLCADILSNARTFSSEELIKYYDWNEKPLPEFVLHFGDRLTSKKLLQWIKEIKPEYVHVSPYPALQDPERILTGRVQADIDEFCREFEAGLDSKWFDCWQDDEPIFQENGSFTEVHAMKQIAALLPSHYGVFLGNGMPIRDADHFFFPNQCRRFFANRGLSGIDGNIATLAGLAEEMPILGIIGDQAALHDINSLPLLKKTKYPVKLLISNNFGGGIFHHLPVYASPHFEKLWGAAHDLRFEKAAQLFDIPYFRFEDLEKSFCETNSSLIECITDRKENYRYQCSQKKH